jgi:hypothetical protein
MNRARSVAALTLWSAAVVAGSALAQQPAPAPPMQPILAGKKFTPPIKGQAEVDFEAVTKRDKDVVVTTMKVKNTSPGPIARLKVVETWFDKSNAAIPGGEGVINGLLQPGEIQTIEIRTPYNAKMNGNSWNFAHANGTIKPHKVKSFDAPNAPAAAKPAATKKK